MIFSGNIFRCKRNVIFFIFFSLQFKLITLCDFRKFNVVYFFLSCFRFKLHHILLLFFLFSSSLSWDGISVQDGGGGGVSMTYIMLWPERKSQHHFFVPPDVTHPLGPSLVWLWKVDICCQEVYIPTCSLALCPL